MQMSLLSRLDDFSMANVLSFCFVPLNHLWYGAASPDVQETCRCLYACYNIDLPWKLMLNRQGISLPPSRGENCAYKKRYARLVHRATIDCVKVGNEGIDETLQAIFKSKHLSVWRECYRLPAEVTRIRFLKSLDLHGCQEIVELPSNLGDLRELETLNLQGMNLLSGIPESIGRLTSLKHLEIGGHEHVFALPSSLADLKSLQMLTIAAWWDLDSLPDCIGSLTSLTTLTIYLCRNIKALPHTITKLRRLRYLSLDSCDRLVKSASVYALVSKIPSLRDLYLCEACAPLKFPRALWHMHNLKNLYLDKSWQGCVPMRFLQLETPEVHWG